MERFSLARGKDRYGSSTQQNKIEVKPHPSEILELSPEEQKKLKEKFAKAKAPTSGKKPEHDPFSDYGRGYVGMKKK
jgi:hypothetical protein